VARGRAHVWPDDGESVVLETGDVLITRGPRPYTVAHTRALPRTRSSSRARAASPSTATSLREEMALGVRSWGNSSTGETVLLTGAYHLEGEVSRRLIRVLPHLLVLTSRDWTTPLVPLLAEEIVKDEPGQEAVLDRLLDLLLIAALRTWFARPTPRPRPGTAATATRSSAGPCGCSSTTRHGAGRWPRSPRRPGCRGPRWPAGSPSWSANRR
jgi:hypothetical protein